jgi:hypothetical protein
MNFDSEKTNAGPVIAYFLPPLYNLKLRRKKYERI